LIAGFVWMPVTGADSVHGLTELLSGRPTDGIIQYYRELCEAAALFINRLARQPAGQEPICAAALWAFNP